MKKIKLSILAATMLCGTLFTVNTKAQVGPCGWDLNQVVTQPTCYKLCNGTISVSTTVNWPDFEYLWSDGSTGSSISGLCENEYMVTVTDDKKCTQSYTISIKDPAQVLANCVTLTNESYPGAADGSIEASATGGDGNFTYEWQTVPVTTGALLSNVGGGNYTVIVYDGNDCTATTSCEIITEEKKDCGPFRSQTMGGWGQCGQNGDNVAVYLFANFASSFPNGLTIGCNRTLKLTSAQAVCDFLPSGSTPKVLPVNAAFVNPAQTYKNVFAGQLVAAMLNTKFDVDDPNFAAGSGYTLGDMVIASGIFANMTVNDLIAEANRKIGGCVSSYTPGALSDALSMVNENYTDGLVDNGFLVCPEDTKEERVAFATSDMSISVVPNPTSTVSNISIYSEKDQHMMVDVYSVSGQKITSLMNSEIAGGEFKSLEFDATSLISGIYFIKIVSENNVVNHKIMVTK